MDHWLCYLYTGDDFFAGYACAGMIDIGVGDFLVGHAVELYLKGAHLHLLGDNTKTRKHGHRVVDLWRDLRKANASFMGDYDLRQSVLNVDFLALSSRCPLSSQDEEHFREHEVFYRIAKHLPDLKYERLSWNTRPNECEFMKSYNFPDQYWIRFFRELRKFIGYPELGGVDHMQSLINCSRLPVSAREYLSGLYG